MKISSIILLFAVLAVFSGLGNAQTKDHPGKEVFTESKCQTCHSVESQKITSKSKKAVDLSDVGAVYRANFMEKFLAKKEKLNGKMHPQAFKGTDEELYQLAEWLQTLNTGKTSTDTKSEKSMKDTTTKKVK